MAKRQAELEERKRLKAMEASKKKAEEEAAKQAEADKMKNMQEIIEAGGLVAANLNDDFDNEGFF